MEMGVGVTQGTSTGRGAAQSQGSALHKCYHRTGAEAHLQFVFCPTNTNIVHPTLSLHAEGIFRRSFSPRAPNTIPERASTEGTIGWELAVDFWFGSTKPVPNHANFVTNSVPKSPRLFSALVFPAPKKTTPNTRHLRGQDPRQFCKEFPSGCRCFWMPIFLCLPTKAC